MGWRRNCLFKFIRMDFFLMVVAFMLSLMMVVSLVKMSTLFWKIDNARERNTDSEHSTVDTFLKLGSSTGNSMSFIPFPLIPEDSDSVNIRGLIKRRNKVVAFFWIIFILFGLIAISQSNK